ncbi:hypothetical protein [Methanosarcina mazei]|nr:hypothetical protein [Methanosarcina mazei]AKB66203.1 hypothetical protein MSMAS_3007 [Methanosarcina mazei S-6]AAM31359.1 conserved protein [Methanosarcina mazei Go1]AKB41918.1 hypothetical protein MSMAW_2927 [Methanosarcina mazei WWM610]KKF99739.1 hypothetical protein DU31_06435 [Methanosarcina mazei]KKG00068.1 hypothetical protein DU40_10690 [Methanosarcina mazei]
MTKETKIHLSSIADDTDLRSLQVRIGDKDLKTPTKAIATNSFYKDTSFPKELCDLQELFLKFDEESLVKKDQDIKFSSEKNRQLKREKEKANSCPYFCLLEFKNKGENWRYPTEKEIEILTNVAYSHSDITPIPSIPKAARNLNVENFDAFVKYLDSCYESIEIRNKKNIMGYIPATVSLFGRELINYYLDKGINAYYVDFDGRMITNYIDMLNAMKRELAKRGYEENHLFHFVNASYGKSINDQKVLSARDILGFGYGLDSLGGIHSGPKRNPEFYEKLKTMKNISRNTKRLLNVKDYGYYRFDSVKDNLDSVYPSDALISMDELNTSTESRLEKYLKIVNLQQQCIEADKLAQVTTEEPNKSLEYFKSKKNVLKNDLKYLSKSSN